MSPVRWRKPARVSDRHVDAYADRNRDVDCDGDGHTD
jgi:hypothetical protein